LVRFEIWLKSKRKLVSIFPLLLNWTTAAVKSPKSKQVERTGNVAKFYERAFGFKALTFFDMGKAKCLLPKRLLRRIPFKVRAIRAKIIY